MLTSWTRSRTRWRRRATPFRSRYAAWGRAVPLLVALACASCGGDPTGTSPPPTPSAADVRFKGVGTTTSSLPRFFSNLVSNQLQVHANRVGTPLTLSPCAPPSPGGANCSWSFALFERPGSGVNTVYYGLGYVAQLETDLAALQRWSFTAVSQPDLDLSSVITSIDIDGRSGTYATSGIQTDRMREFDLAWRSVSPGALQAAALEAGAHGRVITALAFDAANVVYLSYGWERDRSTVYEAKVVAATFGTIERDATELARAGYIITAVGGNVADGYLLIGTRLRGQTAARPLRIATDSIPSDPNDPAGCLGACAAAVSLARDGYAIVGGILGAHEGSSRMFDIFIGEK